MSKQLSHTECGQRKAGKSAGQAGSTRERERRAQGMTESPEGSRGRVHLERADPCGLIGQVVCPGVAQRQGGQDGVLRDE